MKASKKASPRPKPKASAPPRPTSKAENDHYPSKVPLLKRVEVEDPDKTWQVAPNDLSIIDDGAKNPHHYYERLIQKEEDRNTFYRRNMKLCNTTFLDKIFTLGDLKEKNLKRLLYNGVPIPLWDPAVFSLEDAEALKQNFHALPDPPKHPWYRTGLSADKTDPEAVTRLGGDVLAYQACIKPKVKWFKAQHHAIIKKIFDAFEPLGFSVKGVSQAEVGSCANIYIKSEKSVAAAGVFHTDVMYEASNTVQELYESRFGFTVWFCLENGEPPLTFYWNVPQGKHSDQYQQKFG